MGREEGKLKPLDKTVSAYRFNIKLGNDRRHNTKEERSFTEHCVDARADSFKKSTCADKRSFQRTQNIWPHVLYPAYKRSDTDPSFFNLI